MKTAPDLGPAPRILVIRRDNIGDLVCTTPLIHRLREAWPTGRLDALVNNYNAPVLAGSRDLDHVYAYTKAKHRAAKESWLGVHFRRFALLWRLRRVRYQIVILATTATGGRAWRLARQIGAQAILGFADGDCALDYMVPRPSAGEHHVLTMNRLLAPLGISGSAGPVCIRPDPPHSAAALAKVGEVGWLDARPILAIHISARKPLQRWPAANFIHLMRALHQRYQAHFLLFWSPGDEDNPLHPGDDRKAAEIMAAVADLPVLAYPTHQLEELIGGLSVCDAMICSDGGAMHLAAGLGKPIVCFFGNSDATVWHPWGVPYQLLQKPSQNVADISPDEALSAFDALWPDVVLGSGRQASAHQK